MFKLYANDGAVELGVSNFLFKGGEVQVKVQTRRDASLKASASTFYRFNLFANIRSSDDVMTLLLLTDAIRREYGNQPIELELPYLPYARQDRVCAPGEALSLKVFTDLINAQNYDLVRVWDPHSDVATALLDNCDVVKGYTFARKIIDQYRGPMDNLVLVSPDAGANKKIFEAAQYLRISTVVRADKTRDVQTGALSGTEVYGDVKGKDCLILDDIIDGGFTFILLGNKLKELGASKVVLFCTHGIFSKGADALAGAVDEMYCANVWEENVRDTNKRGILRRDLG